MRFRRDSEIGRDAERRDTGGVKGPLSDTYFYPHLQIDMQGSVGMGHGLSFIGYILNRKQ